MDIYSKPDLYDAIHKNYKADNNFISKIAKRTGGPVLELAAGTGRLAKGILDLGLNYTGIDISKEFLKVAKKKYNKKAKFFNSDMRKFKFKKKYKFIFIGFNSFLHLRNKKEALLCLNSVKAHLLSDGIFLASLYIPDPSFLYREENKLFPASEIFQFNGDECQIMETNKYNTKTQMNSLIWYIKKNGEIEKEQYRFDLRMFYPHEMDIIFNEAGLKIEKKYGDYKFSSINTSSNMQIYLCKKA